MRIAFYAPMKPPTSPRPSGDRRMARLLMQALAKFDEIFAVLNDDDSEKMRAIYEWAKTEGRLEGAAKEFIDSVKSSELSDEKIDALIAAMQSARKTRNFARSDEIRNELNTAGIIVEITKDGARWKRK